MYGIYNSDTLVQIIDTMHKMHNKTTWNEKVFACKIDSSYLWYLSKDGVAHHTINLFLFLTTTREKYVKMYERFINQLQMYAKVIRILLKGYLPIPPLPPVTCIVTCIFLLLIYFIFASTIQVLWILIMGT